MGHSGQGITKDTKGQGQPADKQRAQTAHKTGSKASVSKEATRDPKLSDGTKSPDPAPYRMTRAMGRRDKG
jgi:hypothetical protein